MRVLPPLRWTPAQPVPGDGRPSEYGWFGLDEATTASLSPSDCTASPLSAWPPGSTRCSHREQWRSDVRTGEQMLSVSGEKLSVRERPSRVACSAGAVDLGDLAGWTDVVVVVEHGRVAPLAAGQLAQVAGAVGGRSSQRGAGRGQRRGQGRRRGFWSREGWSSPLVLGPGPRLGSMATPGVGGRKSW
jgi:hypothetical protein